MKLRIAKKIRNFIGTNREFNYTKSQKNKALNRYERTKSAKENNEFWNAMMEAMGGESRANLFLKKGQSGTTFKILMESENWEG